ncbi:Hexokinase-2, partial [Penicillium rolfsii]
QHAVDTTFLSIAELDTSEGLRDLREKFDENLSLSSDLEDRKICRLMGMRAERLDVCGITAVCKKEMSCSREASQALRENINWPPDELDLITLNHSEDGTGFGAALAAVLTAGGETKGRSSKIAHIGSMNRDHQSIKK